MALNKEISEREKELQKQETLLHVEITNLQKVCYRAG